jgi:hypothetical protein
MDVALVVDDTGSMGGALTNIQAEIPQIIAAAQVASGGDLLVGLVTIPSDNVVVNVPFTTDLAAIQTAVQALVASGGAGEPESSDEALQYVITGAADPSCSVVASNGPLGTFRSQCVKIAVLITDARPGECADTFTPGVSDVHAHTVALDALQAGVLIGAVFVPDELLTAPENVPVIRAIMQDYATTSGGEYVETAIDGTGAGDGILDIITTCGVNISQCTTRSSQFWFTHGFYLTSTNCVNLLDAIRLNGGVVNLGFLRLPVTYENSGNSLDATDAVMEAMGFYWKGDEQTGDGGPSSQLCEQRKKLSVELIAATANVRLLRTRPENCTYFNGVTVTNFPSNLLQQARTVAAGNDPAACQTMTALLQKFNDDKSGLTNNFVGGLVECSPVPNNMSRSISRDPTTQFSCPGINNSCDTAEAVVFPSPTSANPFPSATFSRSVSLLNQYYVNATNFPTPLCAAGGPGAVWKITPDVGTAGRQFTASTAGSNFGAMLQVLTGVCTNLVALTNGCNTALAGVPPLNRAQVSFTTDGTNTFYIVGESSDGSLGRLKITITSGINPLP